jgi:anti-sigma B factor antagonist
MQLEILEERDGRIPVLRLLGPLDVATADQYRERVARLLEQEPPAIGIDLRQVAFVDSSGMGALLGGKKRALERNVGYFLLDCPAPLQNLLHMVGLDRVIDFCARHELAQRFPVEESPAAPAARRRPARAAQGA